MSYEADLALLAAGSYWDVRKFASDPPVDNRAPLPAGWQIVPGYDTSKSAGAGNGFSARAYAYDMCGGVYAGRTVVDTGQQRYAHDSQGNLAASEGPVVIDNTLLGTAGNDVTNGLTGNDALARVASCQIRNGMERRFRTRRVAKKARRATKVSGVSL